MLSFISRCHVRKITRHPWTIYRDRSIITLGMTFCLEATQKNEMLVYFWKLLKRELSKFPSVLGSQWLKDSQKDEKKCWASDTNVVTGIFQQTSPPPIAARAGGWVWGRGRRWHLFCCFHSNWNQPDNWRKPHAVLTLDLLSVLLRHLKLHDFTPATREPLIIFFP